jgi:D-3-phosphoglycerate dehydrogenase
MPADEAVRVESMPDPVQALIVDLLEWIGPSGRPYAEVMEAWRTSCPKLPVWEEANAHGYVSLRHDPGQPSRVVLTVAGRDRLVASRGAPV